MHNILSINYNPFWKRKVGGGMLGGVHGLGISHTTKWLVQVTF